MFLAFGYFSLLPSSFGLKERDSFVINSGLIFILISIILCLNSFLFLWICLLSSIVLVVYITVIKYLVRLDVVGEGVVCFFSAPLFFYVCEHRFLVSIIFQFF